ASARGTCGRTKEGAPFPDDYTHYELSPGEAFAEAYRVLNDRRAGILGLTWALVHDSFIPTDDTLRAVENDVTAPWLAPTTSVLRGRFAARGARRWRSVLELPPDRLVTREMRTPRGLHHIT